MALPELSQDRLPCCENHTPDLLSAEDALLTAQELPFAIEAAKHTVKDVDSMGFNTARDLARERYLLLKQGRARFIDPFSSRPLNTELTDLLVSKDPLLVEASEFLQKQPRPAARDRFLAWWTLRVGAEHYTCRSSDFSNPRCQAVWRATRHIRERSSPRTQDEKTNADS